MFGFRLSKILAFRKKKDEEHALKKTVSLTDSGVESEESLPCFTSFSELPAELRLKIWGFAIEARVIFMLPRIRTTVPAILQVCKESRAEALPHYDILTYPSLNQEVPGVGGRNNIDSWSKIYFSKEVDTLFYSQSPYGSRDFDWNLPYTDLPTTVQQVHHLALSHATWYRLQNPPHPDLEHISHSFYQALRNNTLKTFTIVQGDFWEAIGINENPEILSSSNVRLVPEPRELYTVDSEAWLRQAKRLHIEKKSLELKFAKLERYALSKFDSQRIATGKPHPLFISDYGEEVSLLRLLLSYFHTFPLQSSVTYKTQSSNLASRTHFLNSGINHRLKPWQTHIL
jgi:hypothetical protein